jgi:hypothetical protein
MKYNKYLYIYQKFCICLKKQMKGLSHFLLEVTDYRRSQGIRVPLPAFLTMIIIGSMGGYNSLQSLARFMENNKEYFIKSFGLLHGVPGYTQTRTILSSIDFRELNKAFYNWAIQFIDPHSSEWVTIDGKGMNSTNSDPHNSRQNFHAMVSIFTKEKGIALAASTYENREESEIKVARELIKTLNRKGLVLTLDAIHCQKKQPKPSWQEEMTM